jgi:hypothetical protein
MMTEEQAWREFQAECPEMLDAVKYQTGRLPGQEPTPIIPMKTASALVNWALAKGYASARGTRRQGTPSICARSSSRRKPRHPMTRNPHSFC